MNLNGKLIVITGAARGLGRAIALELADKGANLALVDLDAEGLAETAEQCRAKGVEANDYRANVAIEGDVQLLFDMVSKQMGAIHGLINNAGITRDGLLVKAKDGEVVSTMSMEQWNQVIAVNLTGTFLCGREAATKMIKDGNPGCIINISSISRHGNMGQTNYTATKAAVEAMAVTWSKELARYGIRAASIAPGYMATEMVMQMKPEALEKIAAGIPAKRLGQPEEIARTVSFILENDYISGRCIETDGGLRI